MRRFLFLHNPFSGFALAPPPPNRGATSEGINTELPVDVCSGAHAARLRLRGRNPHDAPRCNCTFCAHSSFGSLAHFSSPSPGASLDRRVLPRIVGCILHPVAVLSTERHQRVFFFGGGNGNEVNREDDAIEIKRPRFETPFPCALIMMTMMMMMIESSLLCKIFSLKGNSLSLSLSPSQRTFFATQDVDAPKLPIPIISPN